MYNLSYKEEFEGDTIALQRTEVREDISIESTYKLPSEVSYTRSLAFSPFNYLV